jgi:two-component system, NarL family, response regulator
MNRNDLIRILIVNESPIFQEGLGAIIQHEADMSLLAAAGSAREGLSLFRVHQPDVTIINAMLPDSRGEEILVQIRQEHPDARVIVLIASSGTCTSRKRSTLGPTDAS